MTIIERIKAEIERRIRSIENCPFIEAEFGASEKRDGKLIAYKDFLSFLSTLESEKPALTDLEEAAVKYADETYYAYPTEFLEFVKEEIRDAYIAGAKWQKEQDEKELSEKIAGSYQFGLYDKEKMMMKDAVEGILVDNIDGTKDICLHENRFGDKVRIIIVKEDEK